MVTHHTLPVGPMRLRGQRAWGRIKATAAEQRQLWKEVGEALMVGKCATASPRQYGGWIKEHGFSDVPERYRSAAVWLAEHWELTRSITPSVSDPIELQRLFREQASETPPAPEVDLSSAPAPRARLTIETANEMRAPASGIARVT